MSSPADLSPDDARAFAALRRREWVHLILGLVFWVASAGLLAAIFVYLPQPVLIASLVVPVLGFWFWRRHLPVRAQIAAEYRDLAGRPLGLTAGEPVWARPQSMALLPVFTFAGEPFHDLRWCLRGTADGRAVAICNLRLGEWVGNRTSGVVEALRFDGLVIEIGLRRAPPHVVMADPTLTPAPRVLERARLGPAAGLALPPDSPLRLWHDGLPGPGAALRLGERVLTASQRLDPKREALIGLDTGRSTLSIFVALKGEQFLTGAEMQGRARALDNLNQSRAALARLVALGVAVAGAVEQM